HSLDARSEQALLARPRHTEALSGHERAPSPTAAFDGVLARGPMSRIYRSLPPAGTRIGIAYSGGLDTRTAVAWLSRHGLDVHAYTADLGQPDEKNVAEIPPSALAHGAKGARVVDCREAMAREGVIAIQCNAFHLSTGGR